MRTTASQHVLLRAVLVLVAVASGCGNAPRAKKKRPPPLVYVEAARQESISSRLELTGSVEPVRLATIASAAEGPVTRLMAREGDRVEAGAALISIGRSLGAVAGLAAAQGELRQQEDELRRVERLVDSGAIASTSLETAKIGLQRARASFTLAQERQQDFRVRAPWAGIVSRVFVLGGDFVAPRTPLLEMFDPTSLMVRFYVPEKFAMSVEVATPVSVRLDAYPGQTMSARVLRVYPELDAKTRTRTVEAKLTAEAEEVALLKGMFVRLGIALDTVEDAVTVDEAAVVVQPDGSLAAYVIENGVAQLRQVTTGHEAADRVQITEGIQAGEQVVVRGNEKLEDGAKVRLPGREPTSAPQAGAAAVRTP